MPIMLAMTPRPSTTRTKIALYARTSKRNGTMLSNILSVFQKTNLHAHAMLCALEFTLRLNHKRPDSETILTRQRKIVPSSSAAGQYTGNAPKA
jgi:hypothetical protein